MFSLASFLGKDTRFFDLLEAGASQSCHASLALRRILEDPAAPAHISSLREARLKNKNSHEELGELVVKTFITVLEREDIEALSNALYKIPKPIEKFAERFLVVSAHVSGQPFTRQSSLIEQATAIVLEMVKELRKGINIEAIKKLNAGLQQIEAEADSLEVDLLRDLFNTNKEPLKVLILKDLYDLLEKVIDRCRDAGNVITHIFYKNS